jgi:2-keto-3-deoxy-L-rhamnonate aldolase RhmA
LQQKNRLRLFNSGRYIGGRQESRLENKVKAAAASGARIRGAHLTFAAPAVIEILAPCGLDFIYLDGEHGCFDWRDIEVACITAERHGLTTIARVPDPSPATISRYLDRGIKGIVVPHVESVAAAEAVVQAAYFGPHGQRSYGGIRGYGSHADMSAFLEECSNSTSVCIMVETGGSLRAAEDIAAVPGVDYLSFGMMDLAQSLGRPGAPTHPEVQAAMRESASRIRMAGKPVREDFMTFAWVNEILIAGTERLLGKQ